MGKTTLEKFGEKEIRVPGHQYAQMIMAFCGEVLRLFQLLGAEALVFSGTVWEKEGYAYWSIIRLNSGQPAIELRSLTASWNKNHLFLKMSG